ncbi:MAG: hypothetical protein V4556_12490 [Bacteroidota bacterium]
MKTTFLLLLSCILTINSIAQEKNISGARAWKTISLLSGTQIKDAKAILAKEGLIEYKKDTDEATKGVVYFFAADVAEKNYEPDYKLFCINGKVVMLTISYEYSEESTTYKKETSEMKNILKANGFTENKKQRTLQGMLVFDYSTSKKNTDATLVVDEDLANFTLILGETKYVKMATE